MPQEADYSKVILDRLRIFYDRKAPQMRRFFYSFMDVIAAKSPDFAEPFEEN